MPELFESPPKEEAIVDMEVLSAGAINAGKIPINIEKLTSELRIRGLDMSEEEVSKLIDVFRSKIQFFINSNKRQMKAILHLTSKNIIKEKPISRYWF